MDLFLKETIKEHQWLLIDLFCWQKSALLSERLSLRDTHISPVNDPRANIYSPLSLNFASILVNCSLVRRAIIQTGNANVNEFEFAYLYFPMVEMSLVMALYNEKCHCWWPPDTLPAIRRPKRSDCRLQGGNKKGVVLKIKSKCL